MRDKEIERAAPYGGAPEAAAAVAAEAKKNVLVCDPKPRLHIKAPVKLLKLWLKSSDVPGPVVYTVAPVAAAFGVAPVTGVPDETRPGVGALVKYYHERCDGFEVLRVALSRRSAPLTQAVVCDVSTSHERTRCPTRSRARTSPSWSTSPGAGHRVEQLHSR